MVAIVSQNRYDAHQMNNDGVYDCLRKPFRQKEVVHLVKKALEKKQLADKVRNMEQIIDI
jgi:DNA-binding NtrC family response regulator